MVVSLVVVLAQWALAPYVVHWLIPATRVEWRDGAYVTGHALGEIVAGRCAEAGAVQIDRVDVEVAPFRILVI